MPDPVKEKEVKIPAAEEPKEVKVDLETNKEVKSDPAAEAAEKQRAADDKERKRQEFLSRKFEQGLKRLDEVLATIQPKVQPKVEPAEDPIEAAAQKDWKLGVGMVLEQELSKRDQKEKEATEQRAREAKLDRSRQRVLQRYPTIADDDSEEAKLYLQSMNEMAQEDPAIYKNEYGPVLVMNRMEEKLQAMGKVPAAFRPQVEQEVDHEVARRQRIGASSLPAGRQSGSENIVVLSAEDMQICKENAIPVEVYARMKNMSAQQRREGVPVK